MSGGDANTGPEKTLILSDERTIAGKYRVERMLGEGGMGSVYVAEHVDLEKKVAVKLLHESFTDDQVFLQRFKREARAAAAVEHDNVVTVFDTGTDPVDDTPYIVMELLQGEGLSSVLRRERKLSESQAASIAMQILAGLGAAHAKGVVHRDLKPANVFVAQGSDGSTRAKILDFGISKYAQDAATGLTQEGAVIGTPHYMAPEQVKGRADVDHRADLYAVGVMLYRMATGKLPFAAPKAKQVYEKILKGDPNLPREVNPELSAAIESVILHAIHPDIDERYQDADSFRQALLEACPDASSTAPVSLYSIPPPARGDGMISGVQQSGTPTMPAKSNPRSREEIIMENAPTAAAGAHHPSVTGPAATLAGEAKRSPISFVMAGFGALALIASAAIWISASPSDPEPHPGAGGDGIETTSNGEGDETGEGPVLTNLPGPTVYYAVVEYSDHHIVEGDHGALTAYLGRAIDQRVELEIVPPFQFTERVLDTSDGAVLAALSAVRYHRAQKSASEAENGPSLRLLATAQNRGGSFYSGAIITRMNSDVATIEDLRGRPFCYVDPESSSGYVFPRAALRRQNIDPDDFFGTVVMAGDHARAAEMLIAERCDGAAVFNGLLHGEEENIDPQQLRMLLNTGRIPNDAYVLVGADDDLTTRVREALLALHPGTPEAREVLSEVDHLEGFVAPDDEIYDEARQLVDFVESVEH